MVKTIFSHLFPGNTPINLIIEHSKILEELSKELEPLVRDYFDGKDITERVKYISRRESDADDIKFQMKNLLTKSMKVPFSKKDLIYCMHLQDSIVDMIEDVAKRLMINQIDEVIENEIKEEFLNLVSTVKLLIDYLEDAMRELENVVDSSFSEFEKEREEKEVLKVEELESQVDKLTLNLGKWAYSKKNEYNPMDLMFFNNLVLLFSKIADYSENLAEIIRSFTS